MALSLAMVALLSAVLTHAFVMRLPRVPGSIVTFLGMGTIWALVLTAVLVPGYGIGTETVAALLTYTFGCELYLFLSTFSLASISSNILAELRRHPLDERELARRYASERMVRLRIERLLAANLIAEEAGALRLTPKGARMVRIFDRLSALFGH